MWPHDGVTATYLWCFWGLSPVPADVSALPPWCQLSVSLWQCYKLLCHKCLESRFHILLIYKCLQFSPKLFMLLVFGQKEVSHNAGW